MSCDIAPDVSALAINVTIPEGLRWTDTRRGEEFTLTTLNVRLLPDGRLAAKAYGRPAGGGRGTYVSFPVPDRPELATLIVRAASRAGRYGPLIAASADVQLRAIWMAATTEAPNLVLRDANFHQVRGWLGCSSSRHVSEVSQPLGA